MQNHNSSTSTLPLLIATLAVIGNLSQSLANSDKTATYWEGQSYSQNSTVQYSQAKHLISQIPFTGSDRVLDIGCGDGKITLEIAAQLKNGGSIQGIDLSPSMLKVARALLEKTKVPNASFNFVDVLKLDALNQYDKIVSFSTFHWITDQKLAFMKIRDALKPGGKAYLLFNGDHGKKAPMELAIERAIQRPYWNVFLNGKGSGEINSTPSFLTDGIEKADLILNRLDAVRMDETFENRIAFMNWISGWMTSLKYLTPEDRPKFLNGIIDDYLQQVPLLKNGKILFYEYIMEIEVEKKTK